MSKGTPSQGRMRGRTMHIRCRRCGERAYHVRKKRCSHCGYGESSTLKSHAWQNKTALGTVKK